MKTAQLVLPEGTLTLAYDFNAIADAEEIAGCNLLAALENLSDISANQLRGLLYAAVTVAPPAVRPTLVECGEMIRLDTIATVTMALADAYQLATPTADVPATPDAEVPIV
jgi:hypothetical protein